MPMMFNLQSLSRRSFLKLGGYTSLAVALSACGTSAPSPAGGSNYVPTRTTVPDPKDIFFTVVPPGTVPIRLAGHLGDRELAAECDPRGVVHRDASVLHRGEHRADGGYLAEVATLTHAIPL